MFSSNCGIKPLMYTSERASLLNVQGVEDKLIFEKLLITFLFIIRKSNSIWVQDKDKLISSFFLYRSMLLISCIYLHIVYKNNLLKIPMAQNKWQNK